MHRFFLPIVFLFLVSSSMLSAQFNLTGEDLIGTWQNQKDKDDPSKLVIESFDASTGKMSGYFLSPSGTDGGNFRLEGWVNQRPLKDEEQKAEKHQALAVAFSVYWEDYGSITSWTGICFEKDGALQLNTNWMLVRPVTDFEWDHVLTGYDLFVKQQ